MSTATTRLRRARKRHLACGGYCPDIMPGQYYLEHKEFPGGDVGWADAAGHPVRSAECRACAERYGRGHWFPTSSPQPDPLRSEAARPEPSRDGDLGGPGRATNFP